MELSVEDELLKSKELRLSPQLQEIFYKRMERVVVLITTKLKDKDTITGGGVFINSKGFILTSAFLVPDGCKSITFHSADGDRGLLGIDKRDDGLGLAILKPLDDFGFKIDHSILGSEEFVLAGMEVYSICHPATMLDTVVVGQVALNCKTDSPRSCRRVSDVLVQEEWLVCKCQKDPNRDWNYVSTLDKDLDLIQINNLHGSFGSFGSPVFDSCGRVVGILSFVRKNFDFAVHVTTLRKFCEHYVSQPPQPLKENANLSTKKRKRKSSGSHTGTKGSF